MAGPSVAIIDGAAVALDDARLGAGWHDAEAGWRWTDGAAAVRASWAIAFDVVMTGRYWGEASGEGRRLRD